MELARRKKALTGLAVAVGVAGRTGARVRIDAVVARRSVLARIGTAVVDVWKTLEIALF